MNIFVARLNYDTTEQELESLFSPYGDIDSVKIIMDRDTGRSKGYGFVEMPNEEEGLAAIEDLNGTDLDGREIVVKKANPPGGGNNRGGGNRRGGYGDRGGNRGRGGYGGGDRGGYRDRRY